LNTRHDIAALARGDRGGGTAALISKVISAVALIAVMTLVSSRMASTISPT
jgi:hypothetical protein